jgi:hypothetical protein
MFRNPPIDVVNDKPVCRICGWVWEGAPRAAEVNVLPHLQTHRINPWT